jgi:hypothetical protein
MELFTIIGCWPQSRERFASPIHSISPQAVETEMEMQAREMETVFYPAAVIVGDPPMDDTYTAFIDPDDAKNETVSGLVQPFPELKAIEWTVFGIAWDPDSPRSYTESIGQRWCRTVMADSARAAEDVAQSYLQDEGGVLWVCGVLRGTWSRVDTYARFVDPEL